VGWIPQSAWNPPPDCGRRQAAPNEGVSGASAPDRMSRSVTKLAVSGQPLNGHERADSDGRRHWMRATSRARTPCCVQKQTVDGG